MKPTPSIHWLRENAQDRSPHAVMVVDTETRATDPDHPDEMVMRLWCARLMRRHGLEPKQPRAEDFAGDTIAELVALVEAHTRSARTLWLYTHNLNFDLAVTALPARLADAGWKITESALTTDDPWCRMTRGSKRLAIVDSWSFLPTSVDAIGELVGLPKLPLPANDDPPNVWRDRCRVDVAIVADALAALLDWWDAGKYGNWSLTGPATGWSSYRHRRPAPRVLVDPDPAARALEAAAVTGGRRDVWRLGQMPSGLYADLDIATAHLTAMTSLPLPARRLGRFDRLALDDHALHSGVVDVLATCGVETAEPRYPWQSGRGIFYPVGRFHTTLAGPEIRAALARGELRSIGAGYKYTLSGHMAEWATWVASLLAVETPDVAPVVRLLAKHWSRCVPGKWAGHSSDVLGRIPDPRTGWQIERGWIKAGNRPCDWLRIGGELWTIVRDEWADDAFPAVLAWIQSHTRLAMGTLIDALGPAALTCNTDGLLIDARAAVRRWTPAGMALPDSDLAALRALDGACLALDQLIAPFSVRIKGAARRVHIYSPQHIILDGERRLAGIPRRAIQLANGRYQFTQWPKLRLQLQKERPPGYTVRTATVDLQHIPPTGWLDTGGHVLPVLVLPDGAGRDAIQPWGYSAATWSELASREMQHSALRGLMPTAAREAA